MRPEPVVVEWLNGLPPESIWTTSVTVFEVRLGLELLAEGKRRRQLEESFRGCLKRILKAEFCPSTKLRPKPLAVSMRGAAAPAGLSRFAMSRLPVSSTCAKRPSRL